MPEASYPNPMRSNGDLLNQICGVYMAYRNLRTIYVQSICLRCEPLYHARHSILHIRLSSLSVSRAEPKFTKNHWIRQVVANPFDERTITFKTDESNLQWSIRCGGAVCFAVVQMEAETLPFVLCIMILVDHSNLVIFSVYFERKIFGGCITPLGTLGPVQYASRY